jgi:hypothetical protein
VVSVVVSIAVKPQAISSYLVAGEEEAEQQQCKPVELRSYTPIFLVEGSPYLVAEEEEEEALKMRQQDYISFLEEVVVVEEEETFQVVAAEGTFPFQGVVAVVVSFEKTSYVMNLKSENSI